MADGRLRNFLQPRFPLEVQELIIQAFDGSFHGLHSLRIAGYTRPMYETLRSCCLVCHGWRSISQRALFRYVILYDADQFDKLRSLGEISGSSYLLGYIHGIRFAYKSPHHKLGEVILYLARLHLPNLRSLDLVGDIYGFSRTCLPFPFHPSLGAYASQLATIRRLYVNGFKFTHFTEFRRLLDIFRGLQEVDCPHAEFGTDRQGDFRSLYRTRNQGLQRVNFTCGSSSSRVQQPKDTPMFWIVDQQRHRSEGPIHTIYPTLSSDVVRVLVRIRETIRLDGLDGMQWSCIDETAQQWQLGSIEAGVKGEASNFLFCTYRQKTTESVSTPNRPVFGLGDLRLIQLDMSLGFVQFGSATEQLKLLNELLGNLDNLEEVRFNIESHLPSRTSFVIEQISGVGQLFAENLPQARQRCNLKIFNVDGGQLVCWKHLFDLEAEVADRNDYRERGREMLTRTIELRSSSGIPSP